jgi:hypothetical protein
LLAALALIRTLQSHGSPQRASVWRNRVLSIGTKAGCGALDATEAAFQSEKMRRLTGIRTATTKAELNRYFEMINRRVPIRVSQSIKWLRKPSSFAVRLVVALLLILGGIFSFLPVLGLWMLPLGLLFIAQDVPILQKPLVRALAWFEEKWERLKAKWRSR